MQCEDKKPESGEKPSAQKNPTKIQKKINLIHTQYTAQYVQALTMQQRLFYFMYIRRYTGKPCGVSKIKDNYCTKISISSMGVSSLSRSSSAHIVTSISSVVGSDRLLQKYGGSLSSQQVLCDPQFSPSQSGSLR